LIKPHIIKIDKEIIKFKVPIEKIKNLKRYRNEETLDFEDVFANVEAKFSVKLK